MAYHKFRADQLFDGYRMQNDQSVLIMTDEREVEAIVPIAEAGDDIETLTGILSPGFINCHCHLELSHMKDQIPQKTGLADFVTHVIKNRHLPESEILTAIENAENEMISHGIVAVGDICNNTLTISQKLKGKIWYHNFIEASGFLPQIVNERFERAVTIFREYGKHYSIPVMSNSIAPHAPYSVSDELWEKIIHFPGNQLLTIHNQESPGENELFLTKQGEFLQLYTNLGMDSSFFQPSGKTSFQTYSSRFLPNQQVILVHNVYTSQDDLDHQPEGPQFHWCLCPNANLYITEKLPDISLLASKGPVVLGTDSLASNQQLSILAEMQTIHRHFPSTSLEQLFQWATLNGARALQMDNILGSFEKGKQPGVVLSHNDLSSSRRLM